MGWYDRVAKKAFVSLQTRMHPGFRLGEAAVPMTRVLAALVAVAVPDYGPARPPIGDATGKRNI